MAEICAENRERLAELRSKVASFPTLPGVYLMRDISGEVIYVGKAINLRSRVRTYFIGGDGRAQIEFLMRKVCDVENIVTENEPQAFVLERDLIAKYKPRYNIRLKDDRAFLSIRIDESAEWPRLEVVRRIEDDNARYFGPYSFSHELRTLMEVIKRAVPLRTCTDAVFHNRQRPCLEFQIKRCAAPCCLAVDGEAYRRWLAQAVSILEGRSKGLVPQLTAEMERASAELRFEDAAAIRDRIRALEDTTSQQPFVSAGMEMRDAFALYREERLAVVAVLTVRYGRIAESRNFVFSDVQISDEELVEAVVSQYYGQDREIADEIVLPFELTNAHLIEEGLKARRGGAVTLIAPQRGIRVRLLGLAALNARQHFISTFDAETRYLELAREMVQRFRLKQMPRRIEAIDISNFQESDIVGALVSFFDGNPDKSRYRRYILKQTGKPDDFASIYEVVRRRLERGMREGTLPDLLIIDGGPGQLASACRARDELRIGIEIVSLAKMKTESAPTKREIERSPERVYLEYQSEPVALDGASALTHFIQRMRDEVHRFVITFHRTRRAKRVFRSVLDEIPGLGPERRGRLFRAYGSVARMKEVPPDEFAKTGRMPKSLAEKVLRILRESR